MPTRPTVDDDTADAAIDAIVDTAVNAGITDEEDAEILEDNLDSALFIFQIVSSVAIDQFGEEHPELQACINDALAGWTLEESHFLTNLSFAGGFVESPCQTPPPPTPPHTPGAESGARRRSGGAGG
jgi:hypothetical protein